ncbi:MAG: GNAT family N-acetyltransferase [Pseudomonadota bacterium]
MFRIRSYREEDLAALHRINEQSTPGVGEETEATLGRFFAIAQNSFVAEDDGGQPVGFMILMQPGTMAYPSANLRWFEAHTEDLVYVDRVAVDASTRGAGLGAQLYHAAFAASAARYRSIGCEVNREPPNPGSLRFHRRLGFEEVGSQVFEAGKKEVIYLQRALP